MWVLESRERKIVAAVAVEIAESESRAVLQHLLVQAEFRDLGVEELLAGRAEQWATRQGCERISTTLYGVQAELARILESLSYTVQTTEEHPLPVLTLEKTLS